MGKGRWPRWQCRGCCCCAAAAAAGAAVAGGGGGAGADLEPEHYTLNCAEPLRLVKQLWPSLCYRVILVALRCGPAGRTGAVGVPS